MAKLAIGDNLIQLLGLIDNNSGVYQNTATVTGALYTQSGTKVSGTDFSLIYVAASNGNYSNDVQFLSTVVTEGVNYVVLVTAVVSGVQDTWKGTYTASYL